MKCMMSVDGKHINRVSDDKAVELYHEGWRYVAKSLWKEKVRDVEQPEKKNLPKRNPIKCQSHKKTYEEI